MSTNESSNNRNVYYVITIIVLAILLCVACRQCSLNRHDANDARSNIEILNDSIHTYKLSNNQLLATRASLTTTNIALYDSLVVTRRELRDIERKLKNDVREITRVETRIVHDTMFITNNDVVRYDSSYHVAFHDSTQFTRFDATYDFVLNDECDVVRDSFVVTRNETRTSLVCGYDASNTFFVTSSNPNVVFDDITSIAKQEKRKRFTITTFVGIGCGYDVLHNTAFVGPTLGIGVGYKLFDF